MPLDALPVVIPAHRVTDAHIGHTGCADIPRESRTLPNRGARYRHAFKRRVPRAAMFHAELYILGVERRLSLFVSSRPTNYIRGESQAGADEQRQNARYTRSQRQAEPCLGTSHGVCAPGRACSARANWIS
jgi:hypothetical protein